jgi:hypothetical protein
MRGIRCGRWGRAGSRPIRDMRQFLALCWFASAASACDCIGPTVQTELDRSEVVFRGLVTKLTELPSRPDLDRSRSTITFSVSKYWKGIPGKEITLHILAPRPDCNGARFAPKTEYVVFAYRETADDVRIENSLWFGWLDLMPAGTKFLTARSLCSHTEEASKARQTIRSLGQGKRPVDY